MSIVPEDKSEGTINAEELEFDDDPDPGNDGTGEEENEGEESGSEQTPPQEEPEPEPQPTPVPRPTRRRRQPNVLIGGEYTCQTSVPRINDIFEELQTIRLNKPNAIAILFRSLLDLLMGAYIDQKGLTETIKEAQVKEYVTANRKIEERLIKFLRERYTIEATPEEIKRELNLKEEVPARWTPSLGFMLKYFDDNADTLIPHASLREAFKSYMRQQETVTHSEFNAFVHNRFFRPDPAVLTEFWANFNPFITFLIDAITAEEEVQEDEVEEAE